VGLFWFAGVVSQFTEKRINAMKKLRSGNKALLSKMIQVVIYVVVFLIATHALGINMAAFAVLGGTIGIGIGFGLQKITSNFISGMILLFEKSIETDDLIELSNGALGYVRQTYARYTLIETLDGKEVMVPNEDFIINQVTNLSYTDTRSRVEILVGVSYDSDTELARDIMLDTARSLPRSLDSPEPQCYMTEFADSSINLLLYFWIGDITYDRLGPKSDVLRTIRKRFQESNITIPFPQRDVHLIQPNPTTDKP
jgi:small-conductance mechanosensitive channel